MIRHSLFSALSISVWVIVALLLFGSLSHALGDDDQDGPPTHRSNNTQSSGFTANQVGRFPNGNNDVSPLFRFSQSSQFGLPFQAGMGFPFNSAAFQQNGFPQLNSFQQTSLPQQNGFQQNNSPQNGFLQGGFPQNGFQQPGFSPNNFRQNTLPQNGFQQSLLQQQNGGFGQGNQFSSLGLQSQLGGNLGLQNQLSGNSFQNQLGGNGFQNQLGLQNQLGFSQNPLELGLLQQNQMTLQNQFALKNQLGVQNQLGIQNPFQLQNQLGFQNQLRGQQQSPLSFSQQLGPSGFNNELLVSQLGLSNPQLTSSNLGFGQSNFGLGFPQSNSGTLFATTGSESGSSSARPIGSNQVLLQGGQFQESPSLSGLQFGSTNRFPFGTSSVTNNRFSANGVGRGESQFGSQFASQLNSDPFLSQRPQFQFSVGNGQQSKQVREFSPNERALSFNDSFDLTSQFQPQELQQQHQPINNPFVFQQHLSSFNNQPFAGNSQLLPQNQQPLLTQFNAFPLLTLDQQQKQQQGQQQMVPQKEFATFNNRPVLQLQTVPFSNDDDDDTKPLFNHQAAQPQKPQQQSLPLPIAMTDFSCDGRPPGYYADVKNECRTFHICIDDGSASGLKRSFACPNGTLFDQVNSVCQWKESMDCSKSHLFYPRRAASSTESATTASNSEIRPTSSPLNSQIPSPIGGFLNSTPPTNFMFLGVGQPSPAMGSLDAGRSLEDTRRNADNGGIRTRSTLYAPPQIRPPLFRPSERIDDPRKAA